MFYFNVRSLLPKIDDLRLICSLFSPSVLCIVETWLDDSIEDSEICVQGYSIYRVDRNRHGGGVVIYVNDMFTCSVLYKGSPEFELLVISVHCSVDPRPDFCIALFYRSPNSSHALFDTLFSTLCNIYTSMPSKVLLIGDFNVDFLYPHSCLCSKLLSVVSSFNLTQIVSEPTRVTESSSTLIDLIFVSSSVIVNYCSTLPPLANADHYGLQLIMTTKSSICEEVKTSY